MCIEAFEMRPNGKISESDVEASRKQTKGRVNSATRDFLTRLTDSWDIDDDLEELFWAYSSKDMVLSNLTKRDINRMMDGFHDTINDYIMQQPEHDFTWEEMMAIGQFEDWLYARLYRSFEGFERKMETTQTSISRVVEEGRGEEGGGIGDKIKGLFGRGEKEERGGKKRVNQPVP